MTTVVDQRSTSGDGTASRQRFLDRYKDYAKEAVDRAISNGNVTDIGKGGVDVTVPKGGINEPFIHHGRGGINERVHPGNKEFQAGDSVPRPNGGQGGGGKKGSPDGDGEDDFVFHLSEEEFLNYLFNDLELPNLTKKTAESVEQMQMKYAGLASSGPYNKLDFVRSKKKKLGRIFAANAPFDKEIVELLGEEKSILKTYDPTNAVRTTPESTEWQPRKVKIKNLESDIAVLKSSFTSAVSGQDNTRIAEIDQTVEALKKKKRLVPDWNESTDLRFRHHEPKPMPNTKAVMFCLMDVSASMGEEEKTNAKIFYFLQYHFLKRHYESTDVVFIRHHTTAEEVNEQDFFYKKETGGTIVSSALEKMSEIIKKRYPTNEWNIYGSQVSDGDNWSDDDCNKCAKILKEDLLPQSQAFFYMEIAARPQDLWKTYKKVSEEFSDRFWIGRVQERKQIFPLFREFYKKRDNFGQSQGYKAAAFEAA
jgi:uncharacterized sporulation protein YeaH/YhbH (DUF444 family)